MSNDPEVESLACITAWRSLALFDPTRGVPLERWVKRNVKVAVWDYWRKLKRRREEHLDPEQWERKEAEEDYEELIAQPTLQLLTERYIDRWPLDVLASRHGISAAEVKRHLKSALAELLESTADTSMNTFLPYPDFKLSVECLDNARLNKQRVEVVQILGTLEHGGSWKDHPAVRMWRGHAAALSVYGAYACLEHRRRGYRDRCIKLLKLEDYELPPWFGNPAFHASHRSNLLRKDYAHYSKFGWTEPPTIAYVWPV